MLNYRPLDENIGKQEKIKIDKYTELMVHLQRLYSEYSFQISPIVLGATGLITNTLVNNINQLGFRHNECLKLIPRLQRKALSTKK